MFLSTLGCMYLFELVCFIFLGIHPGVGFPSGSVGKESSCSAGDPGSISGLGRFPGEGNGYPFQCSCLENLMYRGAWWAMIHAVTESNTIERLTHTPGMELLSHVVVVFLVFWESSILFSVVVVPICIPTNTVWGLNFLKELILMGCDQC